MAALLATLLAACDDTDAAAWRTSRDPVSTDGLAWVAGSTAHLPDGTMIDLGERARAFAVAGDGVFFVPTDSADVLFVAPGAPVVDTGLAVAAFEIAASPDGRYLATLDTTSGDEDRFGTPQATVLAFDLETGEQIVDSTLGMGDPETDDFAAGYSESEIGIRAITETHLYVQGDAASRFDLATGDGEEYTGLVPSTGLPENLKADIRRAREAAGRAHVIFPHGISR